MKGANREVSVIPEYEAGRTYSCTTAKMDWRKDMTRRSAYVKVAHVAKTKSQSHSNYNE